MSARISQSGFLSKCKSIHGDKYCYKKAIYIDWKTKVEIYCKKCDVVFFQTPSTHYKCRGCPECIKSAMRKKFAQTKENFVDDAIKIHGEFYDYSLVDYVNSNTNVDIICPRHGVFKQKPYTHKGGSGCSQCANERISEMYTKDKDYFIEKATKAHGDRYDYSDSVYIGNETNISIKCRIHGEFSQRKSHHYDGHGCPKCDDEDKRLLYAHTKEIFIDRAVIVHGNVYDYSLVDYINCQTPVKIICSKHGIFRQQPQHHLKSQGCRSCSLSKGEKLVFNLLIKKEIAFEVQKKFKGCVHKRKLPFDFYIPSLNLCIEYQGRQHYEPIKFFGGEKKFNMLKHRDQIKRDFCEENNIRLLEIKYTDIENICEILEPIISQCV